MEPYNEGQMVMHKDVAYEVIGYHPRIYRLLSLYNEENHEAIFVSDDLVYLIK
jgi:hypothetical protein